MTFRTFLRFLLATALGLLFCVLLFVALHSSPVLIIVYFLFPLCFLVAHLLVFVVFRTVGSLFRGRHARSQRDDR